MVEKIDQLVQYKDSTYVVINMDVDTMTEVNYFHILYPNQRKFFYHNYFHRHNFILSSYRVFLLLQTVLQKLLDIYKSITINETITSMTVYVFSFFV